jgi:hypothetical protein
MGKLLAPSPGHDDYLLQPRRRPFEAISEWSAPLYRVDQHHRERRFSRIAAAKGLRFSQPTVQRRLNGAARTVISLIFPGSKLEEFRFKMSYFHLH